MTTELVVMGGGRMGEALVRGLVAADWAGREIAVVEKLADRRRALSLLAKRFPRISVVGSPPPCAGAVIAVKPPDVAQACAALGKAGARRVLCIAAGVRLARLEEWLPGVPVVRAMPNTPALIGAGASAIAGGAAATDADLAWAEGILSAVGTVVRVSEPVLDAVTGLSGSGPAYVFLVAEALTEAGVLVGLGRDLAAQLVTQTLVGAARMLAETGDGPEVLRAAVTSPGGTTAAGLRALEERAVRAAFIEAVAAATARSAELGAG